MTDVHQTAFAAAIKAQGLGMRNWTFARATCRCPATSTITETKHCDECGEILPGLASYAVYTADDLYIGTVLLGTTMLSQKHKWDKRHTNIFDALNKEYARQIS